ncbi:MAG: tetratricopeptide repeat protein [Rhodothermales bacterium]|nr:tetratricopeptide repeat protein [Rhodothermales bacterium]
MRHILLYIAPIALILTLYVGCGQTVIEEPHVSVVPHFKNIVEGAEYVGDVACFDCHEDEYQGYQEHGMANSMYRLDQENQVESFGSEVVLDSLSGLHYITVAADSGFFMEEYLLNSEGEKIHQLFRSMDWVVGSGTSARTYLSEKDGWFYELPVTWYTQQGRWDFSPGYQIANKRFDRKINDRCVVCHNSYPAPVPQTNGMYESMPEGIGCERCHGPGSLHVEQRLISPEAPDSVDSNIINPAHLSLDLRLDVCQQCHLNGTVNLLRDERTAYDFRPSHDLADYISLYSSSKEESSDEIEVISQADRMMKSACFTETMDSLKPLECTTCHDPHAGFRAEGDAFFNAACIDCHSSASLKDTVIGEAEAVHTSESNCVDCHMPKTDLIEAPHSAFTDHWIRVVADKEVVPVSAHQTTDLVPRFDRDKDNSQLAKQFYAMAQITYGYREGDTSSLDIGIKELRALWSEGEISEEAMFLLGYAHILKGEFMSAIGPLEEAVRQDPLIVERLNALAQSYEGAEVNVSKVEPLYREALRIQPKMVNIRLNMGRFLEANGRLKEAESEYTQAIRDEAWNAIAHFNLGTLYLRQGKLDEALALLNDAIELDPFHAGALSNVGLVFVQKEQFERAEKAFLTALDRNPDHVESIDNLGTLYLTLERNTDAINILYRVVTISPNNVAVLTKLALAYFRANQFSNAMEMAQNVLAIDPSNELAQQIVVAVN